MKNILVVMPVEQRHREKLEAAGTGCSFLYRTAAEATEEEVRSADAILGLIPPGRIGGSEKLQWLQLESAGADPYLENGVLADGTVLTNATGAYNRSVAEHAFAQTLMLQKKLHLYRDDQKDCLWRDHGEAATLSRSTVAVVGLGEIGAHYARLVKAMGAYVIGVKRRRSEKPWYVDELALTEELDSVLPRADVIMSVLPGTSATRHIYTAERFAMMKSSALFINVGRGSAVAPEVLYEALRTRQIQAAAIDVSEPEPLGADSPLWQLTNLVITPHVSGGYHLPETFEKVVEITAANLQAFCAGQPLQNVVDRATGYKA